jgi:hypothetical protein
MAYFCESRIYKHRRIGEEKYLGWYIPKALYNLLSLDGGTKLKVFVDVEKKEILLKVGEEEGSEHENG